jgi:hypothetical protein
MEDETEIEGHMQQRDQDVHNKKKKKTAIKAHPVLGLLSIKATKILIIKFA